MASRKPGPYAPLAANYADDEKIMEAGEDAELLYIRMLAYAARTPRTEGWVSDAVILSRLGILPRISGNGTGTETGTDAGSRAARLHDVGLIERAGTGYRITSWLKWNKSVEEMDRDRSNDRRRKGDDDQPSSGNGTGTGTGKATAQRPDSSDQKQKQKQKQKREGRKSPSRPLPDDWAPAASHRQKAASERIDLDKEAEKFRDNALAHDRRYANWDRAFSNWLSKDWVSKLPDQSDIPSFWRDQ